MNHRCETCPLDTEQVSERQVIAGWSLLAEGSQSAQDIAQADLEKLPLPPNKAEAIKVCYLKRVVTGDCETSLLYRFINADFNS